jgi:hypothetical protein
MKAIETIIDVKENGEILLHFPQELKIGLHKIMNGLFYKVTNNRNLALTFIFIVKWNMCKY